jgi:N-acetylmuramoyl-L-alanine amidase
LGYLKAPSDFYDESVEVAIRAFQQERGLTASGIANAMTIRALDEARWKLGDRTLQLIQGAPLMRGDDVATLQSRLVDMGFDCGRVDGIFGARTEAAIKEFQRSAGVVVDGLCGPATVMALMRLMRTVSGGAPSALRDQVKREKRGPVLADKVIVLDPSWGGTTVGREANGVNESDIVFDVAQRIEGRLIALGVSVYLTRNTERSPLEPERIAFANSVNADLVISLHVDSYKNDRAQGVATYFYGSDQHGIHSIVGERFATLVQREICARTDLTNLRTHAKTWDMLRLTKAPTVRTDLGYISNPHDADRLRDPQFRDLIAEAYVIAIQRLYLSAEDDAKTGTLRIEDLRRAGIRR